jgi:hypothetical protein
VTRTVVTPTPGSPNAHLVRSPSSCPIRPPMLVVSTLRPQPLLPQQDLPVGVANRLAGRWSGGKGSATSRSPPLPLIGPVDRADGPRRRPVLDLPTAEPTGSGRIDTTDWSLSGTTPAADWSTRRYTAGAGRTFSRLDPPAHPHIPSSPRATVIPGGDPPAAPVAPSRYSTPTTHSTADEPHHDPSVEGPRNPRQPG